MRYEKNYLTEVVFKLDYEKPPDFADEEPVSFREKIAERFPTHKVAVAVNIEHAVAPDKPGQVEVKASAQKRWISASEDERNSVIVTATSFALSYKDYRDFEGFRAAFSAAWSSFRDLYQVGELSRIGLRYINQIVLLEGSALDWEGYIAPALVSATFGVESATSLELAQTLHTLHTGLAVITGWHSDSACQTATSRAQL